MICTKYIVLEYTNNIKEKISACIILNHLWNYSAKSSAGRAAVVVTVTLIQLNQLTESQPKSAVKFCF